MTRKIIRVGTSYYTSINGELELIPETEAKKTKVAESYGAFTNIPHVMQQNGPWYSHWNLWSHRILMGHPGSWKTIEQFLTHLFQDRYELALNYLQCAIFNPAGRLPILVIIADKDERVGTSTFLWLLNQIQPCNIAIISPKDLIGTYNDRWITKNFCAIEEASSVRTLEAVKLLQNSPTAIRNAKGVLPQEIPSWCKFILKNEEPITGAFNLRPMHITKPDYELPQKMKNEIPGFIYDLKRRNSAKSWVEITKTILHD